MDDETDNCLILSELLKSSGFNVEWTDSPLRAIELVKHTKIDIVTSDYHMPIISGEELFDKIKNDYHFFGKTILVTGSPAKNYNEIGDARFLKPIEFDKILITIKELLNSKKDRLSA